MSIVHIFSVLLIAIVSHIFLLPGILKMVGDTWYKSNYRNVLVAYPSGIFFVITILFTTVVELYINKWFIIDSNINTHVLVIYISVISTSFSGYLDDMGRDAEKGVIGHTKAFLKGDISTGMLKVIFAVLSDFVVCMALGFQGWDLIINILLLLLMQNFFNLLDLRPARAIKAYFIMSIGLLFFILENVLYLHINSGLLLTLVLYLPYETGERCMLGDTGSNVLGIMSGLMAVSIKSVIPKLILLMSLIITHLYSEKYSISFLIHNNRVLEYIDMVGRDYVHQNKEGNCQRCSKKNRKDFHSDS